MKEYKLINGVKIPSIAFGTWKISDEDVTKAVLQAIKVGYRHFDTAAMYKNEEGIGKAIQQSSIPRSELFITTKVWGSERGYQKTRASFDASLKRLQLDYIDLFLIHWPASSTYQEDWEQENIDTWNALIDLYKEGKVKAIGVSNFLPHHLESIQDLEVKPMINQIEFHPGLLQKETLDYCMKHNIQVEAWGPLGRGLMLDHPLLISLSESYQKSVAQLCIKWCLQHQVLPLPKTKSEERMMQNLDVFDFTISGDDMRKIDALTYFGGSEYQPDKNQPK